MTKRHFEAFARECKGLLDAGKGLPHEDERRQYVQFAAETFAKVAQADNARFDVGRFMRACGLLEV